MAAMSLSQFAKRGPGEVSTMRKADCFPPEIPSAGSAKVDGVCRIAGLRVFLRAVCIAATD